MLSGSEHTTQNRIERCTSVAAAVAPSPMPRAWQQVGGAGVVVPTQQLPPPLGHVSADRVGVVGQTGVAQGLEATEALATGPQRGQAAAAVLPGAALHAGVSRFKLTPLMQMACCSAISHTC